MRRLDPNGLACPFGAYAHGVEIPSGARLVKTSGQLGIGADGKIPEGPDAQADLCFANIAAILADADMRAEHVFSITAYVIDRSHMAGYMAARDRFLSGREVASTLLIVSGFTRPEFLVEVEAWAAG